MAKDSDYYTPPQDMRNVAQEYARMRNYAIKRGVAGTRDARAGRPPSQGVSRFYPDPNTLTEFDRREQIGMMSKLAALEAQIANYNSAARSGSVSKSMSGAIEKSMADLMETALKEAAHGSRVTAQAQAGLVEKEMARAEKAIEEASKNVITWDELDDKEGAQALITEISSFLADDISPVSGAALDKLLDMDNATAMAILTEVAHRNGRNFEDVAKAILHTLHDDPEESGDPGESDIGAAKQARFKQILTENNNAWSALHEANEAFHEAQARGKKIGAGLGSGGAFAKELNGLWTDYLRLVRAGEPIPDHMQEALRGMGFKIAESNKEAEKGPKDGEEEEDDLLDKTLAELEKGPTEPVLIRLKRDIVSDPRFIEYMDMRGYTDPDYAFKKFMQESRRLKRDGVKLSRKAEVTNRISGATGGGLLGDVQRLLAGAEGRKSAEEDVELREAGVRTRMFKDRKAERGDPPGPPLDPSREEGAAYGSDDEEAAEDEEAYQIPEVSGATTEPRKGGARAILQSLQGPVPEALRRKKATGSWGGD